MLKCEEYYRFRSTVTGRTTANNSNADFTQLKHQHSASLLIVCSESCLMAHQSTGHAPNLAQLQLIHSSVWITVHIYVYIKLRVIKYCAKWNIYVLLNMAIRSKENVVMKKARQSGKYVHWLNLENNDFWGLPLWILLEEVYFSDLHTNWIWQPKLGFPMGWHQSKIRGSQRERDRKKIRVIKGGTWWEMTWDWINIQ